MLRVSPRPPTEVALVLTFSFQCDQKACPASDFYRENACAFIGGGTEIEKPKEIDQFIFQGDSVNSDTSF